MKKKLIAGILAVSMCIGMLAGCGSKETNQPSQPTSEKASETKTESKTESTPQVQEEEKEIENIVWARYGLYQTGDYEKAQKEVEDALNEYLEEKYGLTVTMKCYTMADYQEQMPLELAADADIDVMSCGTGISDSLRPDTAVQQGLALDITDLLQTEAPKLFESISEDIWSTTLFGGKYYFVPTGRDLTSGWGYVVNNKYVDKFGWDLSTIRTYEDWEPFLEQMKDEDDCAFAFWPASYIQMMKDEYASISQYAGVKIDGDHTKVAFIPEAEEFMTWAKLMKKWADAGYWPEDLMVNEQNYKQMRNAGQYGSYLVIPRATAEYTYESQYSVPCTQVIMTKLWMGSALGSGYIINAKTEQPEASIRFLEALMTDPVVGDLAAFGIEGKHYTREANGSVTKIEESGYQIDSWSVTDLFNISLLSSEPEDKFELTRDFVDQGVLSPITGFVFDASNVSAEYAACNEVVTAYNNLFIYGMVDPEVEVPNYSKALKDAGVDKVIAEMQKQLDAFLANK